MTQVLSRSYTLDWDWFSLWYSVNGNRRNSISNKKNRRKIVSVTNVERKDIFDLPVLNSTRRSKILRALPRPKRR